MTRICEECRVTTTEKLLSLDPVRNKYFCSSCFYRLNPPVFILVRPWYSETYIFPVTGARVFREVEDFEKCGFHLFNHKIYRYSGANPRAQEILTFHYRGKLKCNLLTDTYRNWYPLMPTCQQKHCLYERSFS